MTDEKGLVVMSEAHTLLPDQERVLNATFSNGWERFDVPADGWTFEQMEDVHFHLQDLNEKSQTGLCVVFLSPVPALLKLCILSSTLLDSPSSVLVFHNGKREAKEVPDGKGGRRLVHVVSATGWQLV